MVARRQLPVIQAGDAGPTHGPINEEGRAASSRIAAHSVPFEPPSPTTVKYARHSAFTEHAVTRGAWRLEVVSPEISGLVRPIEIYRATRTSDLVKFAWHGDRETFCPPIWYDLAIGSGACGLGCRHCFLMLTFRSMRDPRRHVVYENVDAHERAVRTWCAAPGRRRQHTLGLGIDCSDSLLYEGVTGHARTLIPLFADPAANPKGCKLILLTKSANTHYLDGLPTANIAVTFSLNPEEIADKWEGKWEDGVRITPPIRHRLEAALSAQELGFEVRFRIDPILPVDSWRKSYTTFFREAAGLGLHPTYITLGTYREKNAQLDAWRAAWGLPAAEWNPDQLMLSRDGTHRHLGEAVRVRIYRDVYRLIRRAWESTGEQPAVELCKETHQVRKAVGFSCTAQCNCLS